MYHVIKNKKKIQKAYQLGSKHPVIEHMMKEGKIRTDGRGHYEIFSYEVMQSGAKHGEAATVGDYIKIDGTGHPYPNGKAYFEEHHKHIKGDEYEQKPVVLKAWDCHEPMCKEIQYLMEKKGFKINSGDFERYYVAPLWGTLEAADQDSKVLFYDVKYHKNGEIEDISFNLIIQQEFENTYSVIGEDFAVRGG